jgi:hypothetical protein
VLFPAALLIILLVVQAGLYFFARQLALSAARHGTQTARLFGHTIADGRTGAADFLREQGGGALRGAHVSASTPTASSVAVRVTGRPLSLLPGFAPTITQVAHAPRERYTTASGQ